MMNISLKCIYILFICTQNFIRFMRKRKVYYIPNFMNLKCLINETVLTFIIGLLVHSLLLIIFKSGTLDLGDK